MFAVKDKERVQVESRDQWRHWLAENHHREEGIWLVTYKKHIKDRYVPRDDLIEEAICFGWIDSLPRRLDDDRTMLWMAPRKPGSGWSKKNKAHAERMIQAGRMTESGLARVESARADGSWNRLDAIEALEIPEDLQHEFDRYASAGTNFGQFPRSVRRSILEWIASAKRPATRKKRVQETARLAQDNLRAHQWRQ